MTQPEVFLIQVWHNQSVAKSGKPKSSETMQILALILPYLTGAFAVWCAVGIARTAVELWRELRPATSPEPSAPAVPLPRPRPATLPRAA